MRRRVLITNAASLIAVAAIVVIAIVTTAYPGRLEYLLLDLRFWVTRQTAQSAHAATASPDVILLRITAETEEAVGTRFGPTWRGRYPELIARLADSGARAVVWDAVFAAANEADRALADALTALPVVAGERGGLRTTEALAEAFAAIGWMELGTIDGVPRRALSQPDRPPLGSVAHAVASGRPAAPPVEERWLDYSTDPLSVRSFDLAALLAATDERLADEARTPLSVFTGRIVFVGVDMEGVDRFRMPGAGGGTIAGVYAQIASYASYASSQPIERIGRWAGAAIVAVVAVVLFVGATARTRIVRGLTPVVAVMVTVVAPIVAFAAWRVWVPQGGLAIATVGSFALATAIRRLELAKNYRESLGFDPDLIERRLRDVSVGGAGVERDAAVLCADVRGYTQLVSDHGSATVFQVMSRYMREMEAIIEHSGGYINKYIGDEIVAVFGFPLDEKTRENRAVAAAHAMLEKLIELRGEWSVTDLPLLDGIGIGIDAGPVRFMRVGGRNRVQFDIIGSAINGASRFQTLTKEHGTPLIVSAEVADGQTIFPLGERSRSDDADDATLLRFVGEVLIRGQGRRRLYDLHAPGISLRYS